MKTNDLINSLSKDVKKVEVVKFTFADLIKVSFVGLLCVLASVAWQGIRFDILEQMSRWSYWVESLMMLCLGLTSILAAMNLSIPDKQKSNMTIIPALPLLVLLLIVGYSFIQYSNLSYVLANGFGCVSQILASAILPAGFLFWMARRAAALKRDKVGLMAALSGLSFGLLTVQLSCYDSSPLHILVWHLLPVLIFAGCGLALGKTILHRI